MSGFWDEFDAPPAQSAPAAPSPAAVPSNDVWAEFDNPGAMAASPPPHVPQSRGVMETLGDAANVALNPVGSAMDLARGPHPPEAQPSTLAPDAQVNPSLFRADSDFSGRPGVGLHDMMWGALKDTFGSGRGAAEYLAKEAGGQIVNTHDGSPAVQLPDGSAYRVNDEGLDSSDVASFLTNVMTFVGPARVMAKAGQASNAGLAGRMGLQSIGAMTTDATMQTAFDGGRVDPARVGLAGVGAAAGEALATAGLAAARKFVPRPAPADGAAAAEAMLREARADKALVPKVAPMMEQVRAGADPSAVLGEAEFGLRYSLGQRLTDPARKMEQLSREELLRQTPQGAAVFEAAGRHNAQQLDTALQGMDARFGAKPGATPAELVRGVQQNVTAQADDLGARISTAYDEAGKSGRTAIKSEAVATLPERLREAVRDFNVHPSLTPAAHATLQQMADGTEKILKRFAYNGRVAGVTLKALEAQRRMLNSSIGSAANRSDRAAVSAMKREFDSWADEAIDNALLSGDPAALATIKEARGLRAEFARRFEGKADTDKLIIGLVDGSRTPEELLNVALGASQVSKAGGARFIDRLRVAAADDESIMGGLRAAHLQRLTRNTKGEPLDLGKIVSGIKATEHSNASIVRALYSPEEWAEVRRLASALEPLIARGEFAKTSGTSERGFRMLRTLATRLGGGFAVNAVDVLMGAARGAQAQRVFSEPVTAAARRVPLGSAPEAPAAMGALAAESQR